MRTISIPKDIPAEFHGGRKQFRAKNHIRGLMRAAPPLGAFLRSGQTVGKGSEVLGLTGRGQPFIVSIPRDAEHRPEQLAVVELSSGSCDPS